MSDLTPFVYIVDGRPKVGTVEDIAHDLDQAERLGESGLVDRIVYGVVGEIRAAASGETYRGHGLQPLRIGTEQSPYDEDDYSKVTVTVEGSGEFADYRIDGRS